MEIPEELLRSLYLTRKISIDKLCVIFECPRSRIESKIKEFGIKKRTRSEAQKVKKHYWGHKIGARLKEIGFKPSNAGKTKESHPELFKWVKRGKDHPLWKGGKGDEGRRFRQSKEYNDWRISVFIRDGRKCIFCGSNKDIEADHIKSFTFFPELRLDIENGRTLCKECHKKVTSKQQKELWAKRRAEKQTLSQDHNNT